MERTNSRAIDRGLQQVGSLGSGNHFLEVQAVDEIYDRHAAGSFGLRSGQVCVMIHCGSRGLGHQICGDHVRAMDKVMARYGIAVPDRQLACAPVSSPEGQGYLRAMAAAANYGRANRQLLAAACQAADGGIDLTLELASLDQVEITGAPSRRPSRCPDCAAAGMKPAAGHAR